MAAQISCCPGCRPRRARPMPNSVVMKATAVRTSAMLAANCLWRSTNTKPTTAPASREEHGTGERAAGYRAQLVEQERPAVALQWLHGSPQVMIEEEAAQELAVGADADQDVPRAGDRQSEDDCRDGPHQPEGLK